MVPRFFFCFQRFAGLLELQRHCRNIRRKCKIADKITDELQMKFTDESKGPAPVMGSALFHFSHDLGAMSFNVSMPGRCFRISSYRASASRRCLPGYVSLSVVSVVPSS